MNAYDRVTLADETKGLILSITKKGERTTVDILTDDYNQIICDPDQVSSIERDGLDLVKEDYTTGGQTYQLYIFEVNHLLWYRMAIWHDYWTKHPGKDGIPPMGIKKQDEYWTFFQRGEVAQLPKQKDIRRSEGIRPQQERMDIGANHDH